MENQSERDRGTTMVRDGTSVRCSNGGFSRDVSSVGVGGPATANPCAFGRASGGGLSSTGWGRFSTEPRRYSSAPGDLTRRGRRPRRNPAWRICRPNRRLRSSSTFGVVDQAVKPPAAVEKMLPEYNNRIISKQHGRGLGDYQIGNLSLRSRKTPAK